MIEAELFDNAVIELLEYSGWNIASLEDKGRLMTADGQRCLLDIRYYKTQQPQLHLIERSIEGALSKAAAFGVKSIVLVTSALLTAVMRRTLQSDSLQNLYLIDRQQILSASITKANVHDQLRSLLSLEEEVSDFSLADISPVGLKKHESQSTQKQLGFRSDAIPLPAPNPPPETRSTSPEFVASAPKESSSVGEFESAALRRNLSGIKTGREQWRQYEILCKKYLDHIFADDIYPLNEQIRSYDGLNRMDLVTRIKPSPSYFWKFLITSFQSQYVVFECKNYKAKVKQEQVLTTEKYLYAKALRKVAFIVSRNGLDQKSGLPAVQGALREAGKLIINISDETMINLLEDKNEGRDPSDRLFSMVDEFLLKLPR